MQLISIRDSDVDGVLDAQIRDLLSLCFTKPGDEVFRTQRFFREPPQHRWFLTGQHDPILAHVALHEKQVTCGSSDIRIGGVAEVCVHPHARGRGYVRKLLDAAHAWLRSQDIPFAVLFGDPRVYQSSGYHSVQNLFLPEKAASGTVTWEPKAAMICELSDRPWPPEHVYLHGAAF